MKKSVLSKKLYIVLFAALALSFILSLGGVFLSVEAAGNVTRGLPFTVENGGTFKLPLSEEPLSSDVEEISFEYKITSGSRIRFMIGSWESYYGYFILDANGGGNRYSGVSTTKLSDGYVRVVLTLSEITTYEMGKPADTAKAVNNNFNHINTSFVYIIIP